MKPIRKDKQTIKINTINSYYFLNKLCLKIKASSHFQDRKNKEAFWGSETERGTKENKEKLHLRSVSSQRSKEVDTQIFRQVD